jgi:CRP-like cAMP-binding protein
MKEGQSAPTVWVIGSGQVELYRREGNRRVVIAVLSAGDVVGDVPILAGHPPAFSARTLSDSVLLRLSVPDLHGFLLQHPGISLRFIVSLAGRLQRMQARLLHQGGGDARHQLAQLLLEGTNGSSGEVRLSQATLAALIGASRPWVNRVLQDFADDGLVELAYRSVTVVDPAGLSRR